MVGRGNLISSGRAKGGEGHRGVVGDELRGDVVEDVEVPGEPWWRVGIVYNVVAVARSKGRWRGNSRGGKDEDAACIRHAEGGGQAAVMSSFS